MKKMFLILIFLFVFSGTSRGQSADPAASCKKEGLNVLCNNSIGMWSGPGYSTKKGESNALLAGMNYYYGVTWMKNGTDLCDFFSPLGSISATIQGQASTNGGFGGIVFSCSPAKLKFQFSIVKVPNIGGVFLSPSFGVGF